MIELVNRMFARATPALSEARVNDAGKFATLHAASFQRGWSEDEFDLLLSDHNVIAHRAMIGERLAGFILSRSAAAEAEILSVAVTSARRGKGLAGELLRLHLRRLAGLGIGTVFLEVDEGNVPARKLYQRAGFREVGRRAGYYRDAAGQPTTALVLRRDLS